jgi:predicted glycosyltransferase
MYVYVPQFQSEPNFRKMLGVGQDEVVGTVRPPATEAHYHNPESDVLLNAALNFLTEQRDVRVVLLPRNQRQATALREEWADPISQGKIVIPARVVDGLNLIWQSDLVISGGGTMNREAAALGVPVYTIFRGKIGAVDRYLAQSGRLVLLERVEDIHDKIVLKRREQVSSDFAEGRNTLAAISEAIVSIAERQCLPAQPAD